jgi:uncharacterized repeat protein (TIGR02543 family)/LPXTG-motif cell wall-anchored protein
LGAAPSLYTQTKTCGVACNRFDIKGGTLEAFAFETALSADSIGLPGAYTYWTGTDDPYETMQMLAYLGAGTCYTGTAPYASGYNYNISDTYIRIATDPFAIVDNSLIAGTADVLLTGLADATISLYGDIKVAKALAGVDAGPWFANLPAGVSVTATAAADASSITLKFAWTPTAVFEATFNIRIPADVLTGGSALAVKFNANAKFDIKRDTPTVSVYTIRYYPNGGTGEAIPSASMEEGSRYSIRPNTFVRSGYAQNGWNTAENGAGTPYADGANIDVWANIDLYAQWASLNVGPDDCNIAYDANGGTGTMAPDTVRQGDDYSIKANAFTRAGYLFAGWDTEASGGGIFYSADAFIHNVRMGVTLYAQWTPAPVISKGAGKGLMLGGANGLISDADGADGTERPDGPYDPEGAGASQYMLAVALGAGGGSYAPGTIVNIKAEPAPEGQVFDKWVITGGGSLADADSEETTYTMPAGSATLTATYKAAALAGPQSAPSQQGPSPQTGDDSNLAVLLAFCLASILGLAGIFARYRRRTRA